jgi:hypothetical protein
VVQAFDDSGNYTSSLLQLHPVLQTVVSTNQLNNDIDLVTGEFLFDLIEPVM